ncbi:MAG: peptidoglycan-binding protein [Geminicoccaceae bacterium]
MRETQRLLTELGYDPGPVDGVYGSKTLRAILAFETDRGLPPTGRPGASLLATLRAASGEPSLARGREDLLGTSTSSAADLPSEAGTAVAPTAGTSAPAASSAAELGAQAGIPTWNGRLLVRGSTGLSGVPTNDAVTRMGHLAILLALKQFPDIVEDDELAFAALELLEEPVQRQIITNAGIEAERVLGVRRYWGRLDEFERRALLQGIRGEAIPILRERAPGLPIPTLVLCSVSFAEYDFDSRYFPIGESASRCDSMRMNVAGYGEADLGNLHSLTIKAPLATEYLPDRVPVPLEDAQDYKRRNLQTVGAYQEVAVLAVEAQLVALKETESERNVRRFELVFDLEGALLFRPDDLTAPFDRLALIPPSSVNTVGASPTGPVPLDGETLNLMLLARELVTLDDSDIKKWAAERANREAFGREGPWPRFFPKEVAKELPFGRQADPLLLANFAEWNRARARALPEAVVFATRTATLDWLQRDGQAGAVQAFDPPGSSAASTYRALAQRLAVPEAQLVVPDAYAMGWFPRTEGLVGLGPVELVLVLPAAREAFTVALDQSIDSRGDFLNVSVAVRVRDLRIDRSEAGPALVVLDVEPVAARVTARALGGAEVGSAAFDIPYAAVVRATAAGDVEEVEPERRAAEAKQARLDAILRGRTGLLLIRRGDADRITQVLAADESVAEQYRTIVLANGLDLPAKARVLGPLGPMTAHFLRNSPRAAVLVDGEVFARELFDLVADLDLEAQALVPEGAAPTEKPIAPPSAMQAVTLETLAPGDAPLLLVRRRGNAPIERVFAPRAVNYASRIGEITGRAHFHRDVELVLDLPERAQTIDLNEAPEVLRMAPGAGVVLQREGLEKILPQISDLDLVAIRFPIEEYQFGIPKDHTKGADAFAILGITGKMDEAAALEELNWTFAPEEIAREPAGDAVRVSRGACDPARATAPATAAEIGAYCLTVALADGVVTRVTLRQVVEGDAAETALAAFAERYGRSQRFREVRHLERGGRRIVVGWGEALHAERDQLGRVGAKSPPAVLEAVIWVVDGVSTVLLHLDDVPTVAEVKAAEAPEIKF